MSITRRHTAKFGSALVEMYRQAEGELTRKLAAQLARGINSPDWATLKLAETGQLRRFIQALLDGLDKQTQGAVSDAVLQAAMTGRRNALLELAAYQRDPRRGGPLTPVQRIGNLAKHAQAGIGGNTAPGFSRTATIARELTDRLAGARSHVLRSALDDYRDVVAKATAQVTLGVKTQREAAADAWSALVGKGLTGFTDRAGRRWALDSYVDMATRTALVQASVDSHLDQLSGLGVTLVQVSNVPAECSRCRPWEGKILDTSPGAPLGERTVRVQHGIQDQMVEVRVAGTMDEARANGLFHPSCRHAVAAYIPGVTSPITHTADPQGEADRDKLRALEREARAAKRARIAALTPGARRDADARVKAASAAIKAHVDATGIQRQRGREVPDLGRGPKLPPPPPPGPKLPSAPKGPAGLAPLPPDKVTVAPSAIGMDNRIVPPRPVPRYTPTGADVAQARAHLPTVTHTGRGMLQAHTTTSQVYHYQAALTPRSVLKLRGVWTPGAGTTADREARSVPNALAFCTSSGSYLSFQRHSIVFNPDYYNDGDISRQLWRDEGTASGQRARLFDPRGMPFKVAPPPGCDDLMASSFHEFGHLVLDLSQDANLHPTYGGQGWTQATMERAFSGWAQELGITVPYRSGRVEMYHMDGLFADRGGNPTAMAAEVGRRLSTYGASNFHEFAAENFSFYSMWGDKCPDYVRQFVEELIRQAER